MHTPSLSIPCESCGQNNAFPHPYIINVKTHPELKASIMNDEIFKYECRYCHHVTYYYHSLIYFDPDLKLFIGYGESQEEFSHILSLEFLGDHFKDYTIRYCENWLSFKEKIQIFSHHRDDRLIALYKDMLLKEFKKTYPDCGRIIAFYDCSPQESIVIISDTYQIKCYSFPNSWYQSHLENAMLSHILHYDTSLIVDDHYIEALYNLHIPVIMVRVATKHFTKDYVVNTNDHIHVGDLAEVYDHGQKISGTIMSIHSIEVREVPHGTKFINNVKPFVPPYERRFQLALERALADISLDHHEIRLNELCRLLEDCIVYLPMKLEDDLLIPETMEDRADQLSFIPLFTNYQEIIEFYDHHYTIAKINFFDLIHQQLLLVDGYLINPFSTALFPIDHHLLTLLDSYTRTQIVN